MYYMYNKIIVCACLHKITTHSEYNNFGDYKNFIQSNPVEFSQNVKIFSRDVATIDSVIFLRTLTDLSADL